MITGPILTPTIQAVQRRHLERLNHLYQGIQPEMVIALDGISYGSSHGLSGVNQIDMLEDPRAWLVDVMQDMAAKADHLADEVTFRPPIIELDPYGVHIIDALFGARVRFHGGQVWSEELKIDLEDLEYPDLGNSALLQKVVRLAALAVQAAREGAGEGQIFVATPVYACAINIAINLFGERLLEALRKRPQTVERVLAIINQTIIQTARLVNAVIPDDIRRNSVAENRLAPAGVSQFDGCSTQLVSRRDYAHFFAPLDVELMQLTPGGALIHLCGAHTHHLPTWAELPGLRAVQLNDRAMDDLEDYYKRLHPETIFYLCPSARVGIDRIMEITGGKRVVLQATLDRPIHVDRVPR